jgi:hypothetical protein
MSNRVKLRPTHPLVRGQVYAAESATATAQRVTLAEATSAQLAAPAAGTAPRRYRARLIEGDRWGSSGYYPASVLKRDGPKAWPVGTQMFLDHPTETEQVERPARSVKDLAAYVATTPAYEGDGLYAEIVVFPHAAGLVASLAEQIGLSIRAAGTASFGEAQGRQGLIFESIDVGYSVDFVTRAGAGGAIVSLLESARTTAQEAGTIGTWLESQLHLALTQLADGMYGDGRLSRAERITLSSAIGDALQAWTAKVDAEAPQLFTRGRWEEPPVDSTTATAEEAAADDTRRALCRALTATYGGKETYLYVRDYDPDKGLVWYDRSSQSGKGDGTFQQGFTASGGDVPDVTLTGDPIAVLERTTFVPVSTSSEALAAPAPAPPTPVTAVENAAVAPTRSEEAPVGDQNTGTQPAAGTASESVTLTANEAALQAQLDTERSARVAAEARSTQIVEARAAEAAAIAARDAAIQEARTLRANQAGQTAVAQAMAEAGNVPEAMRPLIMPRVLERITGRVPLTESGDVDPAALTAAITSAIEAESTFAASLLEAAGHGRVAGLGGSRPGEPTAEESQTRLAGIFGRIGMDEALATTAAKGR